MNKLKNAIEVTAIVQATPDKVWDYWTLPEHIVKWNNASDDWHTTKAANDLKVGGKFSSRMEAHDGSMGFDFSGVYTAVVKNQTIHYLMDDGRKAEIEFITEGDSVRIVEIFEAEDQNSQEIQRGGWQNIMNNFKKYTEEN